MVMADFIFRVASGKLTEAQQQKIAAAIQGAVLTHLAQFDSGGTPTETFLYRPHNWLGGLLIAVDEAAEAPKTRYTIKSSPTNSPTTD
jgi:hypothetical protein